MGYSQQTSETGCRAAGLSTGGCTLTLRSRGRRRGSRVKADGEVRCQAGGPSEQWIHGRLSEISQHGLVFEPPDDRALEDGAAIAGFLRLAGAPNEVEFLGEVVRSLPLQHPGSSGAVARHAIRFLYLAEADRAWLERVMARGRRVDRTWATGSGIRPRQAATTLRLWPVRRHQA